VCGPSVDPALPRFAADLEWLVRHGAAVSRYNLAQQPESFAANLVVTEALHRDGDGALPLVLVDGKPVSRGRYPQRSELAAWAGLTDAATGLDYTPAVEELVAIGAAIASNCSPCLDYHVGKARDLGVDDGVIRSAISTARTVKAAPARAVLRRADELLADADTGTHATTGTGSGPDAVDPDTAGSGGCCDGPVDVALTAAPTASATLTPAGAGDTSTGGCC
jgi:AhpD family alkylhydroperoxidase